MKQCWYQDIYTGETFSEIMPNDANEHKYRTMKCYKVKLLSE